MIGSTTINRAECDFCDLVVETKDDLEPFLEKWAVIKMIVLGGEVRTIHACSSCVPKAAELIGSRYCNGLAVIDRSTHYSPGRKSTACGLDIEENLPKGAALAADRQYVTCRRCLFVLEKQQ